MGVFKALMVLMAFMSTALSLPASIPSTSNTLKLLIDHPQQLSESIPKEAQVSCFASAPSAPIYDLYTAIYDFCVNTFPFDRIMEETAVNKTFDIAGGNTAFLAADLDPITADWLPGDCLHLMGTVVTQCRTDGSSTGDVYYPSGTGFSHFTVKVMAPPNSARSTPEPKSLGFNSNKAVDTSGSCFRYRRGTMENPPTIPAIYAIAAATDFCRMFDGEILVEGDDRTYLMNWVEPHLQVTIHAYRSMSLFEAACGRALDPIVRECSDDNVWTFWGGMMHDELANYIIDVNLLGDDTRRSVEAEEGLEAAVTDTDFVMADRLVDSEVTGPFNATESTNEKFTTTCNSFPWSENPISIDFDTAYRAMDYMCFTLQGRALAKDDQIPLNFPDNNPPLFANVVALDTLVVTINDCNWAFDTLFKACVWESRYYGGVIDVGVTRYVLEFPPRSFNTPSAISAPALPARSVTTNGSSNVTVDRAENLCYNELGYFTPKSYAMTAAWLVCSVIGTNDWEKGQEGSWPLQDEALGQSVLLTIEAYLGSGMSPGFCFSSFSAIIENCSVVDSYFGGVKTYMGYVLTLSVTNPVAAKNTVGYSSHEATPALSSRQATGDDLCWNVIGHTTHVEAAGAAMVMLCVELGYGHLNKGDVRSYTLTLFNPPVKATLEAIEDADMNKELCFNSFNSFIDDCTVMTTFFGGSRTYEEVKLTVEILDPVPGVPLTDHDITTAVKTPLSLGASDCDHNGIAVDRVRAYSAAAALCFEVGDVEWEEGNGTTHLDKHGDIWISARILAQGVISFDVAQCVVTSSSLISNCTSANQFCGGTLDAHGARWSLDLTHAPQASGEIESRSVASRQSYVTPYDSTAACAASGPPFVLWYQAFGDAIEFCRSLDGTTLEAKQTYQSVYRHDGAWVHLRFSSASAVQATYEGCIEMFDAANRQCREWELVSGATIHFADYWAQFQVTLNIAAAKAVRSSSNANASLDQSLHARQGQGCMIAEATPIDKQAASEAIGQFCPQFSGHFIVANDVVSDTIRLGSDSISMQVRAIDADGYMLHAQQCIGGFEMLLTECSSGFNSTWTKGGTLVGESAAFSLSMAYV